MVFDMREELFRDLSSFGGMPIYLAVMAITFFYNQLLLSQLFFGLLLAYFVTTSFRIAYFKNRPEKQKYRNWLEKIDASSFPSLHSMRSVVLVVILTSYFSNIFLTLFFVAVAASVVATRILLKRHDPVDSIGGALMGFVLGLIVIAYAPLIPIGL